MNITKKLISVIMCTVLLMTLVPLNTDLFVNKVSASISDTSVESMMFYEYLKDSKIEIMKTLSFPNNYKESEKISALIDDFNSDGKKEMLLFDLHGVGLFEIRNGKIYYDQKNFIDWTLGYWIGNGSDKVCAEYKNNIIFVYRNTLNYGGNWYHRDYLSFSITKDNTIKKLSHYNLSVRNGIATCQSFNEPISEHDFDHLVKEAGFNVSDHYHNDYFTGSVHAQLFEGFRGNHIFSLYISNWDFAPGVITGYLYDNTKLKANVDFEIRASKPDMHYYIDEQFLLGAFHTSNNIIDKTTQYSVSVSNSDVVEFIKNQKSDGITSFLFLAKNSGEALITIKEFLSGVSRVIKVTVSKDRLNCFMCEKLSNYGFLVENIYCDSFKCSNIRDNSHSISFDAYNGYYTYGIVEVYNENGDFLEATLIEPISASSGVELFVDSISYLGYDLFYSDHIFYHDPENYKQTPVNLNNIPNGSKIILTNNNTLSDRLAFYNGVDIFVSILIETLPFSVNISDKNKVVATFANDLLVNLSDTAFKDLTKSISSAIAKGGTESSAKSIYEALMDISKQLNLDAGKRLTDSLVGLGYSFADTAVSIVVSPFELLNKTIDILEIVSKIDDLYACNNNESSVFIASYHVDKLKKLTSNGVVAESEKGFTKEVFNVELYEGDIEIELKSGEFLNTIPYEIDMYLDGVKTVPDATVTVSIPIPEGFNKKECGILRQEKDGSYSFLETRINGDYITFETDHFSLYILFEAYDIDKIEIKQNIKKGDIDGNGKITAADARLVLRASVGLEKFSTAQTTAGDIDKNKKITAADARLILRASVGLEKPIDWMK